MGDDKEDPLPPRKYSSPLIKPCKDLEASNRPSRRKFSQANCDPMFAGSGLTGEGEGRGRHERADSSASSTKSTVSSKSRWKLSLFSRSKRDSGVTEPEESEFLPVCPPLESVESDINDPSQAEMRRDIEEFFEKKQRPDESKTEEEKPEGEAKDNYSWQSPSSWGFLGKETYSMNARPRRLSSDKPIDLENLWALKIFKPVEVADGVMSRVGASSGYSHVTISCDLEGTAAEICQMLIRKFTSNRDLSRYRLYVMHKNTERLLEHDDQPAKMLRDFLFTMGYTDEDQLNKIAREDHSYCCRFIFHEYPPAPPRSEDFLEESQSNSQSRKSEAHSPIAAAGKARITFRSAYLADVNLAVMPTVLFQHAKTTEFMDLSRNTLLSLPDDLFEMLQNLRLLRLIGNLLKKVPSAILTCPSITHLDLTSNLLTGEALKVLADMPNLTHLSISCNKISDLPIELSKLTSLRSLDLSSNYLTKLPDCIWSMTELRELNVSFNQIVAIPDDIVRLNLLRSLILVGNAITMVTPRIKELQSLRQLDLRGNLLSKLEGIDEISFLVEISFDYNELTSISCPNWPDLINFSCVNSSLTRVAIDNYLHCLKKLDLSSNELVSLPDDLFTYMSSLDTLILADNELTKLPQSINLLTKLEKFDAHSNTIAEVNLQLSHLALLSTLNLHTNNIRSVTADIWNAPSLRTINLSSNFLSSFPQAPISMTPLPLSNSLVELLIADNRLTDDISDVIMTLKELSVLNVSYNRIFDLGDCLGQLAKLVELYLSGNGMTAFPEDIDKCQLLRILFINGNKLANLPADLGKNSQLSVFDVQSNILKYNINNWPYDWNWNFNTELQYLNLAHNKKLEIRAANLSFAGSSGGGGGSSSKLSQSHHYHASPERSLSDFKSMHKLHLLDLTDVQVSPLCLPDGATNLQIRTSKDQSSLKVAVAEYCGRDINFDISEFVTKSFMGQEKDHLVGLFDGRGHDFVSSYLNDTLEENLKMELRRMKQGELFSVALRRAFLGTNRMLSMQPVDMKRGSTACLLYVLENQLLVANVGDTMAVMSREGSAHVLTTKHHPWARGEQARIRNLGGYISLQGLVEQDLPITRAFGYHHLLPYVNANPSISELVLEPKDEFVLIATRAFWEVMSYQMAIDVARRERADPEAAVQKLRDIAIARGVTESIKIMFVDFHGIRTTNTDDGAALLTLTTERRRNAFKRQDGISDQVLSRLEDEIPPPKPPCAFVFTDIKESTKLWSLMPNAMRVAIKQHNNIMRRLMRINRGYEVKTEGDAFVVAFQSAIDALQFCLSVQLQMLDNEWPREILESPVCASVPSEDGLVLFRGLSVRMGIHYGMADDEEDKVARRMDYHGIDMIIASRVSALADGGQINITETVRNMYMELPEQDRADIVTHDLGLVTLKGLQAPERLHVVYPKKLSARHSMRRSSNDTERMISQLHVLTMLEESS